VDDTVSDYTSLAYYYSKEHAGLTTTDTVTIGDAASEEVHALSADGAERGSLTGYFEGTRTTCRAPLPP